MADWIEELSNLDRTSLLLLKTYEKERQNAGQYGYRIYRDSPEILKSMQFKQLRTVTKWMQSQNVKITWKNVHWTGYVQFVFEQMSPTIPQPGQLKNLKLLRQFITSVPKQQDIKKRSGDEMERIYKRVYRREIANNPRIMRNLGLRDIDDAV